ncbi:TnpA family transposase [Rhodococcus ruber BKS 20-38]|uniref:TnpA family transposase n=1 Tax=Rhodococcus ruber BKS 20-38 TaxID=1278076 RepID=M2ZJ85_9NOCA|nr:transposase [Rhodococcus ruber]EME67367.1 TnpA family transposase [Rhodococcus ruber BKS 20-38]
MQHIDARGLQLAYDSAYGAMAAAVDRNRLDAAIAAMFENSDCMSVVTRFGCLGGVGALTVFGLTVEIGDRHRLTGRSIGACLGLVPIDPSGGGGE